MHTGNIVLMSKPRSIVLLLIIVAIAILIKVTVMGSIASFIFPPSHASSSDTLIEDIGGDNFLTATLDGCLKINEENISDASFKTSSGEWRWYDAKNITYVTQYGTKNYMIVWKTAHDKYDFKNEGVNLYLSDYLTDSAAKCFIEYSYENDCVYGIIIGTDNLRYSESQLMYDILGLNRTGFELAYSNSGTSYGGGYSGSGSSYHTVVPDRYTLSRTDPGAYYDHYEYGDNYDIDNYLESEGYD